MITSRFLSWTRSQAAIVHGCISGEDAVDVQHCHRVKITKITQRNFIFCDLFSAARNAQLNLPQPSTTVEVPAPIHCKLDGWLSFYNVLPFIPLYELCSGLQSTLSAVTREIARGYSIRNFVVLASRGEVTWNKNCIARELREWSFLLKTINFSWQSINEAADILPKFERTQAQLQEDI